MDGYMAVVEKNSEIHPWLQMYRTGESVLRPEHEMRYKQIDIIARLAMSMEILPEFCFYNPANYGPNDNE